MLRDSSAPHCEVPVCAQPCRQMSSRRPCLQKGAMVSLSRTAVCFDVFSLQRSYACFSYFIQLLIWIGKLSHKREKEIIRFRNYTRKKFTKMYAVFFGGSLLFQTYGKYRVSHYVVRRTLHWTVNAQFCYPTMMRISSNCPDKWDVSRFTCQ